MSRSGSFLASAEAQRKRELDLSAARFITDNRKAIFEGSADDKELFAKVIPTLFPPEVAAPLLRRLEKTTVGPERKIWQDARQQSESGAKFTPDGRYFVTSSDDKVRFWDSQTSNILREFRVNGIVSGTAFSPDGKQLLITMLDGAVQRWDIATGRLLQTTPSSR